MLNSKIYENGCPPMEYDDFTNGYDYLTLNMKIFFRILRTLEQCFLLFVLFFFALLAH
uniref:Uncharacterized protein n=1 Tax=Arundo donax TaxID=35708 RepID=A0A0A8XUS0_ARUDO